MIEAFMQGDIGCFVLYTDESGKKTVGRVKSFNNSTRQARVVYSCNGRWSDYMNYAGELSGYERLEKVNPRNYGITP